MSGSHHRRITHDSHVRFFWNPKYTRSRFRVSALVYTYELFPLRAVRVVRRSVRLLKGKAGGQDRNDGLLESQTRYL